MSQLWKEWEQLEPGCVAIVEGMGAVRARLCHKWKEWEQLEPDFDTVVEGMGAVRARLCRNCGMNGSS